MANLIIRDGQMQAMATSRPTLILPCDIWIRVAVRDNAHRPCTSCGYEMKAAGKLFNGSTDEDGVAAVRLPRGTKSGTLTVSVAGKDGEPVTWDLEIGPMEAATSKPGAVARLQNLEFLRDGDDADDPRIFKEAVANFQSWVGLEMTGVLDQETADALQRACTPALSSNPAASSLPDNPGGEAMARAMRRMLEIDRAAPPEDDEE